MTLAPDTRSAVLAMQADPAQMTAPREVATCLADAPAGPYSSAAMRATSRKCRGQRATCVRSFAAALTLMAVALCVKSGDPPEGQQRRHRLMTARGQGARSGRRRLAREKCRANGRERHHEHGRI